MAGVGFVEKALRDVNKKGDCGVAEVLDKN